MTVLGDTTDRETYTGFTGFDGLWYSPQLKRGAVYTVYAGHGTGHSYSTDCKYGVAWPPGTSRLGFTNGISCTNMANVFDQVAGTIDFYPAAFVPSSAASTTTGAAARLATASRPSTGFVARAPALAADLRLREHVLAGSPARRARAGGRGAPSRRQRRYVAGGGVGGAPGSLSPLRA